jgi:sulfate adenylyltransferase
MSHLIPPHGDLKEPVCCTVQEDRISEVRKETESLPKLPVSDADLSTVYRFGDGGLSPLTGPMTRNVYNRVLDAESIEHNGKAYAWTIPLSLPADRDAVGSFKIGGKAALVNIKGKAVGILTVRDVFPWDKPRYNKCVYLTERTDHPGARIANDDPRDMLVGGEVEVLPQPKHPEYGRYVLTPRETRALFAKRKWERVVAFQTRNPLHRAHEYALVVGVERLAREGHFTGAVLNPLIGETKGDDVDAATRMRTYRVLHDRRLLGDGDKDEVLWKEKGYDINDNFELIGLDIKMFYGGPKEAVMHGIYRQNFGFTDIIIGRKHADAPYDDGTDIWDPLEAQRIFDNLKGDLKIKPVKVGFAAFYEELGRVGLVEDYAPKGYHPVSISGRQLRETLRAGNKPDPRIMRSETAEILIQKMHG